MVTERKAHLTREHSTEKETLGVFSTLNGSQLWVAKSLELPWLKNIHNESCIPAGIYLCRFTRSNRMSLKAGHDVFTYEILNVPNRAGIRIHSASFFHDLLGCVSLGNAAQDIDGDGELDLTGSRDAVAKLVSIMEQQDFTLYID